MRACMGAAHANLTLAKVVRGLQRCGMAKAHYTHTHTHTDTHTHRCDSHAPVAGGSDGLNRT